MLVIVLVRVIIITVLVTIIIMSFIIILFPLLLGSLLSHVDLCSKLNLRLRSFTTSSSIGHLLIEVIIVEAGVDKHSAVVKGFNIFIEWGHLLVKRGFFPEPFDNINEDERVESCIMHLRLSQRSSFPVRHLFDFANTFGEDALGDLGETCLILNIEDLTVICLSIDEIGDELYKLKLGVFL